MQPITHTHTPDSPSYTVRLHVYMSSMSACYSSAFTGTHSIYYKWGSLLHTDVCNKPDTPRD